MNWKVQDFLTWEQTSEYIDTVLIPFVPFNWDNKEIVNESEYINLLLHEIEKSLKGRVLVTIPFTYLREEEKDLVWKRFNSVEAYFLSKGFTHVIPLTCDLTWQQWNQEIIVIRPLPIYDMEKSHIGRLVKYEGDSVYKQIVSMWG